MSSDIDELTARNTPGPEQMDSHNNQGPSNALSTNHVSNATSDIRNHDNGNKSQNMASRQTSEDEKSMNGGLHPHLLAQSPQGHQKPLSYPSDKAAGFQGSAPTQTSSAHFQNLGSLFPSTGALVTPQPKVSPYQTTSGYNQSPSQTPNSSNHQNGSSVSPNGTSTFNNHNSLHSPDTKPGPNNMMHSLTSPSLMHQNHKPPVQHQPKPSHLGANQFSSYQNFSPYNQQQFPPSAAASASSSMPTSISPMPPSNSLPPPAILPQFASGPFEGTMPSDSQFQQSMKSFQTNRLTPQPNSSLNGPMTSHNKVTKSSKPLHDRPYKCDYPKCDWAFTRASDLKRHLKSHNTPNYHCPYWKNDPTCHRNGGAFNRLDVLKRHLKLVHYIQDKQDLIIPTSNPKDDPGWCRSCQRMFHNSKEFIDHCQDCSRMIPPSKWQHQHPPPPGSEHLPPHERHDHGYPDHDHKTIGVHSTPQSPPHIYPSNKSHMPHHNGELMNYNVKDNQDFLNDPNNNLITLSSVINEFENERKK